MSLLDRRLLFVTGKGGVGKTTLAAALGVLGARGGQRVLVCEMERRGDLARLFDVGPTGYLPSELRPGLFGMTMDTEAALREYLRLNLKIPTAGRIAPLAQAFDFIASAAPGVREILTVGKLCYEVREDHYDLVVVDASATGHIVGHLAAPGAMSDLVRRGAVAQQTAWMTEMLDDPVMTGVVVVATPEEMPVSEAIDLVGRLDSETDVPLGALVVNRVLPELFGRGEEEVFASLETLPAETALAGALGASPAVFATLFSAARSAVAARRSAVSQLERLRGALPGAVPLLLVPELFAAPESPGALDLIANALGDEIEEL